jgi:hypothetical protein
VIQSRRVERREDRAEFLVRNGFVPVTEFEQRLGLTGWAVSENELQGYFRNLIRRFQLLLPREKCCIVSIGFVVCPSTRMVDACSVRLRMGGKFACDPIGSGSD